MKKNTVVMAGCGAAVLAAATWSSAAGAQPPSAEQQSTVVTPQPVVVAPQPVVVAPQPTVTEHTTYSAPNPVLLGTGLIVLGGSYIPSVIVAAANNTSYDNHLYIPVVGPWLDLGNRPSCGGFGQTGCGTEDGYKALLIIDGVAQGVGAVATVLGLVVPQRHTTMVVAKADKPTVHVLPAQLNRDAYGVAAFGNF